MTEHREAFDNFIHLSVDLVNSATSIIEEIGGLKMRRRKGDYHPRDMLDLRKALSKAVRSLESYDAIVKTGPANSTREEYQAARLLPGTDKSAPERNAGVAEPLRSTVNSFSSGADQ